LYKEISFPITFVDSTPPAISNALLNPSIIYEGDDVSIEYNITDTDLETIDATYELTNTATSEKITLTEQINPLSGSYGKISKLLKLNIVKGNYTLKLTLKDGRDLTDVKSINFTAYEHSVTGNVDHNSTWEENRVKYNMDKTNTPNSPRTKDIFWSTEEFVLTSKSTDIVPSSKDICNSVRVEILNEGYQTDLTTIDNENWSKVYFSSDMLNKWGKPPEVLRFRFTGRFLNNNGTQNITKTFDVNITVDNIDSYFRVHRIY
jgi:hypothetical protein